jgi:hypothetical protein
MGGASGLENHFAIFRSMRYLARIQETDGSSGTKFLKFLSAQWIIERAADDPAPFGSRGIDYFGDAVNYGAAAQFDIHQGSWTHGDREKKTDTVCGDVTDD